MNDIQAEDTPIALPGLDGLNRETRLRIEAAVLDIFSRREFYRVGLIEVARGANVSLQTIYKYYGSKEALLFSCLDARLSELAMRMMDHLQGIEDYKERLRKTFWVVLDFFDRNHELVQLMMSSVYVNSWRKHGNYQHRELFGAFIRVLAEGRSRGILTDEVEEKVLLDYIIGVLGRVVQMHVQRGDGRSLGAQCNVLFEMLWRAIARPQST